MSAHTSEPWTIITDPAMKHGDWFDNGGYRIDAKDVEQLCYVWNASNRLLHDHAQEDGPRFGSDEGEANACLIAAAPDLLEACNLLLNCMYLAGWDDDFAAKKAREAIARATGKKS
jgi:hypothetical protein